MDEMMFNGDDDSFPSSKCDPEQDAPLDLVVLQKVKEDVFRDEKLKESKQIIMTDGSSLIINPHSLDSTEIAAQIEMETDDDDDEDDNPILDSFVRSHESDIMDTIDDVSISCSRGIIQVSNPVRYGRSNSPHISPYDTDTPDSPPRCETPDSPSPTSSYGNQTLASPPLYERPSSPLASYGVEPPASPLGYEIPTSPQPISSYGTNNPVSPLGYENPTSPLGYVNPASRVYDVPSSTKLSSYGNENPSSPLGYETPATPPYCPSSPMEAEYTPESPPNGDTPPASPMTEEIPSSPLAEDTPASPPVEDTQASPSAEYTPSSPLVEDTQASPSAEYTPSSPPPEDTPASPSAEDTAVSPPAEDTPGSPPAEDTPGSPPAEDTPGSPPAEDTPGSPPGEDTPNSPPPEYTPGSPSAEETPILPSHDSPPPRTSHRNKKRDSQIVDSGVEGPLEDSTMNIKQEILVSSLNHNSPQINVESCSSTTHKIKIEKNGISKIKKENNKKVEIIIVDPEDLEEGEIEDDEEDDGIEEIIKNDEEEENNILIKTEKISPFIKIFGGDKENHKKDKKEDKKSNRKESSHTHGGHKDKESPKNKDKESNSNNSSSTTTKDKDKDKDRKKKRKHSESINNDVMDEDEIIRTKILSRDKKSRKSSENNDMDVMIGGPSSLVGGPEEDDDSYLFVRGGSPPTPNNNQLTAKQLALQNFAYASNNDGNDFGRMYGMDEDLSDEEINRRGSGGPGVGGRRHRSPLNRRRRPEIREENARGGRRGGPGAGRNKEETNKSTKSDIICAYYMQGKCQKSHDECSFSHNAVPPRKMELCKFWMMDCCAKREKCLYLHNDFPCKFYHTGLVCKMAERCKFSHKPLNEITKAVLLKHIETAPKEILGDFPRLNRNGALNLINKMEAKILGALAEQERQKEKELEPPRRTRWEQPTRDDQEKLQELMEEAGIGGFYRETLECAPTSGPTTQVAPPPTLHHSNLPSLMGGIQFLPPPSLIPQPAPVLVQNAALASVLANLNIPSSTIQPIQNMVEEPKPVVQPQPSPLIDVHPLSQTEDTENPYWNSKTANATPKDPSSLLHDPPEHLPPMQKELFLRIQQQQLKNQNKAANADSDEDERPDDDGWYSSDDEERDKRGNTTAQQDGQTKSQPPNQNQQGIDISSVISSIRQTVETPSKNKTRNTPSPTGRGDVDLRTAPSNNPSQSHGPFGDTDFRLPSLRPDLRDIDLRLTTSPGPAPSSVMDNPRLSTSGPLAFLKLPTGPATEIDASINSHPPVQYKLKIVLGVDKPDYRYIRHTLSPSQILMDPRLGPRPGSGTLSLIPDPASPPPSTHSTHHAPATIPADDNVIMDPRVRRSAAHVHVQQQQQQEQQNQHMSLPQSALPGILGDPRFPRDPRNMQIGTPGGWPNTDDLAQAALAAQFMSAHQQMGIPPLFPFPNTGGFPFIPPDFSTMGQIPGGSGQGHMTHLNQTPRSQFQGNRGRGRGRPASSWERYSQQQSDPDGGNNIGSSSGMSPSL